MNPQPSTIDPCADGIRPHFCIRHIPQWPDNSPQMEALRREVAATEIVQPIQMTATHEIVDPDSRERWRAARSLQLPKIPVAYVAEDQVDVALINALVHRRHLTKSALAYLIYPRLKTAMAEAQERHFKILKKGNVFPSSPQATMGTVEALAEHHGVERSLLFEAKKVHEIFAKDPSYKAQMEPRILAEPIGGEHEQRRPVGLGAVLAGYGGKQNEIEGIRQASQLDLFTTGVRTLVKRVQYWVNLPADQRRRALETIESDLDQLDPDVCDQLADLFRTLAKQAAAKKG